ncbi:TIGR00730 family Rossman fold protein [Elizabethkingia argentiflava]|uniref:Cytokinin riboside 5'-monophosphate phosphoribohydrolase n=1 Tax=Elizabethkingia argenteiflava TaxID=2681556 RepID=A0A845PYM0_9FLAO|nr:TIGR00730 family Rossman fold protein [Elizabethkingia argenteiflava]NAW51547.1 TIGR00730 family Rossman fold protein [Elizabethkingia argenteiflava]
MKRISVFCGSNSGTDNIYTERAYEIGKILAQQNIELVYGGAKVGLMVAIANGVIENKGKTIGVLPFFLQEVEIAHENLSELILVETMHQRKIKMSELSDGFIALPGGFGTLEEFFEVLTWAQLGLHKKNVAILNINGFYDPLLSFTQTMVNNGFLKPINQKQIIISDSIEDLLRKMKNYKAINIGKWMNQKKT